MSDGEKRKPIGINKSSNKTRYITMILDTSKIKKEFFTFAENGKVYLNIKLHLKPDGEVDKYQQLGMVTQEVPKEIYEKAPKDDKPSGEILGNGKELWWPEKGEVQTKSYDDLSPEAQKKAMDNLPF